MFMVKCLLSKLNPFSCAISILRSNTSCLINLCILWKHAHEVIFSLISHLVITERFPRTHKWVCLQGRCIWGQFSSLIYRIFYLLILNLYKSWPNWVCHWSTVAVSSFISHKHRAATDMPGGSGRSNQGHKAPATILLLLREPSCQHLTLRC